MSVGVQKKKRETKRSQLAPPNPCFLCGIVEYSAFISSTLGKDTSPAPSAQILSTKEYFSI